MIAPSLKMPIASQKARAALFDQIKQKFSPQQRQQLSQRLGKKWNHASDSQLREVLGIKAEASKGKAPKPSKTARPALGAKRYESAKQSQAVAIAIKRKLGLSDQSVEEIHNNLRSEIKKVIDQRRKQSPNASDQELRAAAIKAVKNTISKLKNSSVPTKVATEKSRPQNKKQETEGRKPKSKTAPTTSKSDPLTSVSAATTLGSGVEITEQERKAYQQQLESERKQDLLSNGKKLVKKIPGAPPPYAEDIAGLQAYSYLHYRGMNRVLRGDTEGIKPVQVKQLETHTKFAVAALDALPPHEGVVYRGTFLPESIISKYKVGQVVTEKAFASTSTNHEVAISFRDTGKKGKDQLSIPVMYTIKSKNGRSIKKLSILEKEDEVLFRPGTQFKVLDKKKVRIQVGVLTKRTLGVEYHNNDEKPASTTRPGKPQPVGQRRTGECARGAGSFHFGATENY